MEPEYNIFRPAYWLGEVDSRPLSLFRIVFALILLKDALYHFPLIGWFYTDNGLMPREAVWHIARPHRFSLMDALPYEWMVVLFFVLWVMVLLALLVGYRTRLMSILNFLMVLSIQERNIWILNGGDTVFRVLSFWMMFIPLAHFYSVDAVLERWQRAIIRGQVEELRVSQQPKMAFALFMRLIQLQFTLIYVFAFLHKLPGNVWMHGWALHYALQLKMVVLPSGDWVLQHFPTDLLRVMTVGALVTEGSFFVLVFAPVLQPYLRVIALSSGTALHLGIGVLMSIGNFSTIMIAGYLLFFESRWVVWLDRKLRLPCQPVTIPAPAPESWVWLLLALTRDDEIAISKDAVEEPPAIELLAHLPLSRLWVRFAILRAGFIRFAGWSVRHSLAIVPMPKPFVLRKPAPFQRWSGRLIASLILLPMMVGVWWVNAHQVKGDDNLPIIRSLDSRLETVIQFAGLWQAWDLFAPYPLRMDGWIVIPGVFEDGETYDLRTGATLTWEMPRIHYGWNERWKNYQIHAWRQQNPEYLGAWGSYYCRLYNDTQQRPVGKRLATLEIHWRYQRTVNPGEAPEQWRDMFLWRHWCYPEYQYYNERSEHNESLCFPFCAVDSEKSDEDEGDP